MTAQNIPPANLALTATTPTHARAQLVPSTDLVLTAEAPLVHRAVLLTTRWKFYDPVLDETWTMPINPDSMTNPIKVKGFAFGRNVRSGGRFTTVRQVPRPVEWEFGGVIRTKAHHDALDEWVGRRRIIQVTDHVHRTYEVMLTGFEVTERAPTKSGVRWRLRYSMKALLLRQLA